MIFIVYMYKCMLHSAFFPFPLIEITGSNGKAKECSQTKRTKPLMPPPPVSDVDHRVTITFAQLATNIFKGTAKRQGLGDPGYLAISVNQMKSFLDEFSKGRLVP